MKILFRIAKTELKYYFYSPIAWFVLIIFTYFNSGFLLDNLAGFAATQDASNDLLDGAFEGFPRSLTTDIIGSAIKSSIGFLLLFLPLITTNVINKDFSQGTIKLLNSSPVKNWQIVLGKYLGVMFFAVLMIATVLTVYQVGAGMIRNVDYSWVFTMFLGLLLVSSVYIAIGIYLSSVTSYPILAGLLTIFIIFLLKILVMFGQNNDLYREISHYLKISGKAERFLRGLITTKDLVYFILLTLLFLVFTTNKLHAKMVSRNRLKLLGKNMGTLAVVVLLLKLTSIHGYIGYWDTTRAQHNTIDERVQKLLAEMDGSPIRATLYVNILGGQSYQGMPRNRNEYIWDFWERYLRFYPDVEFDYVYYYAINDADSAKFHQTYPGKSVEEMARMGAKNNGLDFSEFLGPDEIGKLIDLSEEDKSLCLTLEYKGKKTFLRTYQEFFVWPEDCYNMAGALQVLLSDTMPRFKFLSNHYERSPFKMGEREYGGGFNMKAGRYSFINSNLFCDTIRDLDMSGFNEKDLLVIADPRSSFSPGMIDTIRSYIDSGRDLVVFAEPGKHEVINPVLEHVGLEMLSGTAVLSTTEDVPDKLQAGFTEKGVRLLTDLQREQFRRGGRKNIRAAYAGVGSLSVVDDRFLWDTIAFVENRKGLVWLKNEAFVRDSAALAFNPATDVPGGDRIMLGAHLKRKINNREQKILVFSDADMYANSRADDNPMRASVFSYCFDYDYPVETPFNGTPVDAMLSVNKTRVKTYGFLVRYVFTGMLLLAGVIILIRRKRK